MECLAEIKGNRYVFSNYVRNNEITRNSFNALSKKIFGLSFENWYKNGYWKDGFIPYVLLHNGEVVANVSVNIMNMSYCGVKKEYIQLGTIMTDTSYRNQGLSRYLMNVVLNEFVDKSDGIYLFANDSVLEFYPKFGFEKVDEYQYYYKSAIELGAGAEKLDMSNVNDVNFLRKMATYGNPYSKLKMIDIDSMLMFYCSQFMQDSVYYSRNYNAIIIAELTNEAVLCYEVLCDNNNVPLQKILSTVATKQMTKIKLGFTPSEINNCELNLFKEENTTLFMLNKKENLFENNDLMFPLLSHA